MGNFDSSLMEYNPEMETFEQEQFEWGETEWGGEAESVLSEADEMALAAELLDVTNEEELDRFLGGLIRRVGGAVGKVVKSPVGQAIGGVLKGVAKKALPIAGGALGAYFGGPLGAKIGSGLAQAAGGALGLELEALSQEDREFEGAKQFVRFAADTVNNATSAPPSVDPRNAAQSAALAAAQKYAPNLLRPTAAAPSSMPQKTRGGRWIRRGRNIIIVNC
jgi:hypothetical protein